MVMIVEDHLYHAELIVMKKTALIDLSSREHTQMLLDLRKLLRPYGVTLSLTGRDAALELINAACPIDNEKVQQLRSGLVTLLPKTQDCYLSGEPYEKVICENCKGALYLDSPMPLEQYVACSCGHLLLFIIEDKRAYLRQTVHLDGLYRHEGENSRLGQVVVENLSYGGCRLRVLAPHDIAVRDRLTISFTLDNKDQTIVHQTIEVTHVKGDIIGANFPSSQDLDHNLASYLGVNWVRK